MNNPDLWYSKLHVLIQMTASTNFYITDYNSFWKIHCFNFFQYKNIGDQIWPCCKTGQSQTRGIIWTNLVALEYSMLHIKFQVIGLSVPEKKIFEGFYHIWAWRPSWSCDLDRLNMLSFPHPKRAPHEIWLQIWPRGNWGKEAEKYWIWVTLVQGQWMTLTFDIHVCSCTHLVKCIYQLWYHWLL